MNGSELVLRFLRSIGRAGEAETYLRLFRADEPSRFALIAVDPTVASEAADALVVDLQFLASLDLTPVVLFSEAKYARHAAERSDDGVAVVVSADQAAETTRAGTIPLVVAEPLELVRRLAPHKVVLLRDQAGLRTMEGTQRSIVDVTTEYDEVHSSLSADQAAVLASARALLDAADHRMTVAITSPLALLRELFTVTGAGTLVRRGATVVAYKSYDDLDRARLEQLMSSAFGRAPVPSFFDRPVDRIYIAGDYRGAAVFTPTDLGGYLSKFAVDVAAQGEGIGRDLWRAMARDYPTYYWRSHPNNPIASWYRNNCDGFVRGESWHVYWRGMPTEKVPAAVDYATGQPADFATGQPADFATK